MNNLNVPWWQQYQIDVFTFKWPHNHHHHHLASHTTTQTHNEKFHAYMNFSPDRVVGSASLLFPANVLIIIAHHLTLKWFKDMASDWKNGLLSAIFWKTVMRGKLCPFHFPIYQNLQTLNVNHFLVIKPTTGHYQLLVFLLWVPLSIRTHKKKLCL